MLTGTDVIRMISKTESKACTRSYFEQGWANRVTVGARTEPHPETNTKFYLLGRVLIKLNGILTGFKKD